MTAESDEAPMVVGIKPSDVLDFRFQGLAYALTVILLWMTGIIVGVFFIEIQLRTIPIILGLVALNTFLFTGLFITAHDAMHRSLMPKDPFWNDFLGQVAVLLFALFSYRRLRIKHGEHHAHPASGDDPDYHAERSGFVSWYIHFMREYVTWPQLLGMSLVFCAFYLAGAGPLNIVIFWAMPAILSTVQLFYFGTYLPHRRPLAGYDNRHRATSTELPRWLSLLTCYHFGYHYEHHEYPYIPWWKLGQLRPRLIQQIPS